MPHPRQRQREDRTRRIPGRMNGPYTTRAGRGYNRIPMGTSVDTWTISFSGNVPAQPESFGSEPWESDTSSQLQLLGISLFEALEDDMTFILSIGEESYFITVTAGQTGTETVISGLVFTGQTLIMYVGGPIPVDFSMIMTVTLTGTHEDVALSPAP